MTNSFLTRRAFGACALGAGVGVLRAETSVDQAHCQIWQRFITRRSVMLDYVGLNGHIDHPSAEEYRLGKPNALAWWTPTENGAMFNGLYLVGLLNRFAVRGQADDKRKARRLVQGLRILGSVARMPGFAARGVSMDGKSCPLLSSTDQFFPWFLGLWRYWRSPIPTSSERNKIRALLSQAVGEIRRLRYRVPTPPALRVGELGLGLDGFLPLDVEQAPRMLFLVRAAQEITGDPSWNAIYREYLPERLPFLRQGWSVEQLKNNAWTAIEAVLAVDGLADLDSDPEHQAIFRDSLQRTAEAAVTRLKAHLATELDYTTVFDPDWRKMNTAWTPQRSLNEARDVARKQGLIFSRQSPRWPQERLHVGEPLNLAWMIALPRDKEHLVAHRELITGTLGRYQYDKLYVARFFAAECAWFQLQSGLLG
ncbi:MAG: hypothetical protein H7039_13750 [Bryobacteraceae bacterium]|nr:hypothetical protein [Bryobacteraceae bacterium]